MANLPDDVTELITEAVNALDADAHTLLTAMSACAPEGFRLALAASLVDVNESAALNALQQLISRSLAEEIDRGQRRYRLHSLIREAARGRELLARLHAEVLAKQFESWETEWRTREEDWADFQLALGWVLANPEHLPEGFAERFARNGFLFSDRTGHNLEAFEICEQFRRSAEQRNDKNWLPVWYGYQALILKDWGRLEEALALLQKVEAICLELGKQDGLQASYGNQGTILHTWGRLEEALALYKKVEAICLELGNKDALQTTYHNQALILKSWGRLEEALVLHKKEEAISLELGNKSSLGYCYWSWGLLARDLKDPQSEHEKLSKALAIFTALKMPRERDAVAAELAKTSGAA